jgi:hypothetical protein
MSGDVLVKCLMTGIDSWVDIEFGSTAFMTSTFTCNFIIHLDYNETKARSDERWAPAFCDALGSHINGYGDRWETAWIFLESLLLVLWYDVDQICAWPLNFRDQKFLYMRCGRVIAYHRCVGPRHEWGCMSQRQRTGIERSVDIEFGSTAFMTSTCTCNHHPLGL